MLKGSAESSGFCAAQGQQIVQRNAEPLLGVLPEVLLDERGSEPVKTSGHRGVGGEKIARPGDRQCGFKGLACLFHEGAGPLQHRERRVPFIQVADLRLQAPARAAGAIHRSPAAAPA